MVGILGIDGEDFTGKHVLIRTDFNVSVDANGNVMDFFKIEAAKKTIRKVFSFPGAKVALLSHYGRPEGRYDEKFSLRPLVKDISRILDLPIRFVDDCVGSPVETGLESLSEGEVLLLENVRFHEGDEENDRGFASMLARPFDVFVNEAFGACHREHASIAAITERLPSFAGYRLLEEIRKLDDFRRHPSHPAVAIIGGAKIETKLPLIREFERTYEAVLVGGKIANEALDRKIEFSDKVLLPVDFRGDDRLDIGPKTTAMFVKVISVAKSILWNGPMGKFEEKTIQESDK
jgi:phosphoglycerate kinase